MRVTDFLTDTLLQYQRSDSREVVARFNNRVHFEAGGYLAPLTHYARAKLSYSFPEGKQIITRTVVEIPVDFYRLHEASFKLITVGTESPYQRTGLWIDSNGYPRLQYEIKGAPLKTLWKGDKRLPIGKHIIRLDVAPPLLTRLLVDGQIWAESRETNMLDGNVNRIVWGIDGAAEQSTKRLALDIWEMVVR